MNALHSRRIDENLVHRHRPRHFRDRARIELEAEVALGLAIGVGLIEVGAQGRLDQRQIAPENAVLVEHRDLVQRTQDRLFEALLLVRQVFLAQLARQVEAGLEQAHQLARDIGVIEQRAGDIAQVEAHANLLEVAPVGPQQRHLTPGQAGREHQAVEGIVLGRAGMNLDEGILQRLVDFQQVDFQPLGIGEGEIVNPVFPPFLASQTERKLAQHAQAQVLQDRQHVRQRQWPIGMVELAMQAVLHRGDRLVEAHYQGLLIAQAEDVLHVHRCRMRGETLAITGGKAFRKVAQDRRATGFAEALVDQARIIVLPGAAGLDDFLLQLRRIDLQWPGGIQAQQELHTVEHRLGKVGGEFAAAGPEAIDQHLLDAQARLGRVTVARDIDQAIAEAAVGIDPQEQPQLVALLDLHDGDGGVEQLVEGHLEQLVAGQHLQYLDQFLAQVCRFVEARTPNHLRHLAADIRNPPHALGVDRGGEEAEKAALLDHPALVVHHPQRYVIRIGRPVHAARRRRLGEGQQQGLAQVSQGLGHDQLIGFAQPGAQMARQAQQRGLVIKNATAVGLLRHAELFVAEEGEMIVGQPAHEIGDFRQLSFVSVLQVAQPGMQLLRLVFHGSKVIDDQAHIGEHPQQRLLQFAHGGGTGAAVDLDEDQRFGTAVLGAFPLGQQLQQAAFGIAPHLQHAVLQGMDAVAAARQFHAHRIDQERHVRVQYLEHAMGRLPAVLFVVRVEYLHLGRGRVETLQQAPTGQGGADQVGHASFGEFGKCDDAEELFGEAPYLRQKRLVDVLCQGCLQLLLEVGFAGRCKERHLVLHWACWVRMDSIVTGATPRRFKVSLDGHRCSKVAPPAGYRKRRRGRQALPAQVVFERPASSVRTCRSSHRRGACRPSHAAETPRRFSLEDSIRWNTVKP